MVSRKRARITEDDEDEVKAPVEAPSMLQQIRNMWEFASFMQFLFLFGKAFKVEDFEIEVRLCPLTVYTYIFASLTHLHSNLRTS